MKKAILIPLILIPINSFIYFFFVHYALSNNCFSCSFTWINVISSLLVGIVIACSHKIAEWLFVKKKPAEKQEEKAGKGIE